MTTIHFPEANAKFGPPDDMSEAQVRTIHAYAGEAKRGSCEGTMLVVVAWQPDERELAALNAGQPIFLTCLGGLPAHFLTTNFAEATNPA